MNTPALLLVAFAFLYVLTNVGLSIATCIALQGKFTKFNVNMLPSLFITALILLAAYAADSHL